MWFRTDLRLHDNTALHFAQKDSDCIALFIISPKQWKLHDDADCKVDFWLRQLQELAQDLNDLVPVMVQMGMKTKTLLPFRLCIEAF